MGAIATRPQGSVGNLIGPGSWNDNTVLRADGDDSNDVQGSTVVLSDGGVFTGVAGLTASGTVQAGTFSDGTASLTGGAITGLTALNSITATELSQLETIGTTTISAAQWGYLGELDQSLVQAASPTFVGATLSGLTASRLMATGGGSVVGSVANLASWVAGTANQVVVTDDTDGTITLSAPQDIAAASSPSFTGLTVSGLTATRIVATGAGGVLASVANLASWVAGTSNRVTVADDGDGTITLSGPQDIHSSASPTFVGATLSGQIGRAHV